MCDQAGKKVEQIKSLPFDIGLRFMMLSSVTWLRPWGNRNEAGCGSVFASRAPDLRILSRYPEVWPCESSSGNLSTFL